MKTWISILTVSVILLGIAYMNLYCSHMQFDNNSAGVVISSLGVMVTALVGWQIYSLIDIKQIKKEREELSHDIDIKIHKLHVNLYSTAVANSKGSIQVNDSNDIRKVEFLVILNYLRLFYHKIHLEEFDECNEQIRLMFYDIKQRNPITLTKQENTLIVKLIADINDLCFKKHFIPFRPLIDICDYIEIIK